MLSSIVYEYMRFSQRFGVLESWAHVVMYTPVRESLDLPSLATAGLIDVFCSLLL